MSNVYSQAVFLASETHKSRRPSCGGLTRIPEPSLLQVLILKPCNRHDKEPRQEMVVIVEGRHTANLSLDFLDSGKPSHQQGIP